MVKAVDCKSIIYRFESDSCLLYIPLGQWLGYHSYMVKIIGSSPIRNTKMEALSNWLARQTVNLVSSELVGSSPAASTL